MTKKWLSILVASVMTMGVVLSMGTSKPISQTSDTLRASAIRLNLSCPGTTFPETYWLISFLPSF